MEGASKVRVFHYFTRLMQCTNKIYSTKAMDQLFFKKISHQEGLGAEINLGEARNPGQLENNSKVILFRQAEALNVLNN